MIDSKTYHKIYNQLAMKYRRFNNDPNWKTETKIEGLTFKEALEKALAEQERRQQLGVERHEVKAKPRPEPQRYEGLFEVEGQKQKPLEPIEEPNDFDPNKIGSQPIEPRSEYSGLEQVLKETFGSGEEQKVRENKAIEQIVNAQLEAQRTPVCKKCRANPCRCKDEEAF